MLRTSESETEILLGNKQLLGIFFVVVVLLGVAFVGGYKVGQASDKKTAAAAPATGDGAAAAPGAATSAVGETHSLPGAPSGSSEQTSSSSQSGSATGANPSTGPSTTQAPLGADAQPPLGSAKHPKTARARTAAGTLPAIATGEPAAYVTSFAPQGGQTFLQVAAVSRDEAEAIADVLHKKGFRAHAVPKPGALKIYRVLIGPVRDTGDLSSTRDLLRKTGFREIFVQRY